MRSFPRPSLSLVAPAGAALLFAACADSATQPTATPSAPSATAAAAQPHLPSAAKAAAASTEAAALASQADVIPGQYIVVFRDGRSGVSTGASSAAEAADVTAQDQR